MKTGLHEFTLNIQINPSNSLVTLLSKCGEIVMPQNLYSFFGLLHLKIAAIQKTWWSSKMTWCVQAQWHKGFVISSHMQNISHNLRGFAITVHGAQIKKYQKYTSFGPKPEKRIWISKASKASNLKMAPSRVPPSGSSRSSTSKSSPSKARKVAAKVEKKPKKAATPATKNKGEPKAAAVNEKKIVKVSAEGQ